MKKLLCLAVCLSALACTACAENKSFGSRLYQEEPKKNDRPEATEVIEPVLEGK